MRKLESLGRKEGSGETSCEGKSVPGRVSTIQVKMLHMVLQAVEDEGVTG